LIYPLPPRRACPGLKRASVTLCALLGGLAGGCTLTPNVPEPEPVIPGHYRAASSLTIDQWPPAQWWRNFDSPELARLIREARRANPKIAAAAARVTQADAQIRESGAGLFPSLDAKASATKNYRAGVSGGRTQTANVPARGARQQTTYEAALDASYEIDFWGKNRAKLSDARHSALASRFDKATVSLSVDASVATTYFTIVALTRRLQIAKRNLANARELLKALRARMHAGVGTALDVAQQKSQVDAQRAAIPPLRRDLQQNFNALAVLLGKAPAELRLNITEPAKIAVPEVAPGLPAALMTRRPDIAEAVADLKSARANVQVAKAQLFPSINLSAQGGWEAMTIAALFDPLSRFYSLAAQLTAPLFHGGQLRGQLSESRGRYMELLADYRKSVISAFEDVDNALTGMHQSRRTEQRQRQAVDSAQLAYSIARAKLHEGVADVTTVLDTERALFNAQDALVQDRLSRLQAAVSMYQALGGGWDEAEAKKTTEYTDMPGW
jgi:NodT family efflux transporter outer membrane factor (OMF) lipoprotein